MWRVPGLVLVLASALWRGPLGGDEAAGAPGPLDRVELALAGAERALGRTQAALEQAMVTQSLNQLLERVGLAARFDPGVDLTPSGKPARSRGLWRTLCQEMPRPEPMWASCTWFRLPIS